ncbi:MAG: DUF1653 domain-containing protein [Bacilli bacterium]|nr:DUF1653 domain-containing protein [Bacilli bacterium]
MERVIEIGKTYRHFKGHIVKVIDFAEHTENGENLVIYKHLGTNKIWARPYDMFNSLVDREKYPNVEQEYRFEEVDE